MRITRYIIPRAPFHPSHLPPTAISLRTAHSRTPQRRYSRHSHRSHPNPLHKYHQLVQTGTLRNDDHQQRIVELIQALHDQVLPYSPPPQQDQVQSSGFFRGLFSKSNEVPTTPPSGAPKSLYLYGDVGTGKTMIMDLFYHSLPSFLKKKRRIHFHAFMVDVHKRIHAAKARLGKGGGDPILPVARDLASEAYVLCFDEFQVTDIADAMILRRLLESLLNLGVIFVMTSNRHPDELYKNGIQRSSFIPAIDLLKSQFVVAPLDSGTDYRRIPRALAKVYYYPLNDETRREIDKLWDAMTADTEPSDPVVTNHTLISWGRPVKIPLSTSTMARFPFNDICGNKSPMGAADYLEITQQYRTIFVTDIPKMDLNSKDLARRFITFIDACYESRTHLFLSSEVPITQIFSGDDTNEGVSNRMLDAMEDSELSSEAIGESPMFTGDEEVFAFARACSRLVEMGSKQWINRPD